MKNLIVILFLSLSAVSYGQDSTQVKEASVKALTTHGHLTLFIGKEIQHTELDQYMQKDFDCRTYGKAALTPLTNGDQVLKYGFIRSIPGEKKQTPIDVAYTLTNKGGVIKKVVITGDRVDMAELFLFYWPTKVTVEDIKSKKVAEERLLSDRIIYQSDGDKALITITHL
jgi:hypothetical protein